jgi:cyclic pyranopterin monophosphate synthase
MENRDLKADLKAKREPKDGSSSRSSSESMPRGSRWLTHIDAQGRPTMVDVAGKAITARAATAECRVTFPASVAVQLRADGLKSAKGGVVDTAIVAGTMAVKRTYELIPFCHPLPIDGIRFAIDWRGERTLEIVCTVNTTHKTGVEMEALTGATVAALTVYDMCKALSHAIVLGPAKLRGKRGGKRDFGSVGDRFEGRIG